MIKNKFAKAAIGAALVVGGVTGFSQSAMAAVTHDTFPAGGSGWYSSTDDGGRMGVYYGDAGIDWENYGGQSEMDDYISVYSYVHDQKGDGTGPFVKVLICPNDNVHGCKEYHWHDLNGVGSTTPYLATYSGINVTDYSTVKVWMCNGAGTDGNGANCDGGHGPFHQY